jgi:hypothetical protein
MVHASMPTRLDLDTELLYPECCWPERPARWSRDYELWYVETHEQEYAEVCDAKNVLD